VSNEQFLSAGTPLVETGRLEDLEVEADVLSLDVVDVRPGDPVEIYGPTIGRDPAPGKIERIEPAGFTKISSPGVEQQRVKVIIDIDPEDLVRLRNEKNLGVGYRVRVRIIHRGKDQRPSGPPPSVTLPRPLRPMAALLHQQRPREDHPRPDRDDERPRRPRPGKLGPASPESTLNNGDRVKPVVRN
jgi:HlyD family secretion protein